MRQARFHVPGVVQHLIWRFVDHRWFIAGDEERACYLRWLGRALSDSDWRCLAFALMSNHIHVAAVAGREPLAAWSRRVNLPFARWINDRLGRIGPVFADRANDWATAPTGVANLIAYIHNNPVRAGVVTHARDSDWTSHAAYINCVTPLAWLHVSEGLDLVQQDRNSFDAFVEGQPPDPVRPKRRPLAATVQHYAQLNIATPFERQFPLVMRPFGTVRPDPRRVLALVCAELGLSPSEVASRRQLPEFRQARAATVQCGLASGLSGADVGAVLGLTQQAVSWVARNSKRPQAICERVLEQLRREAYAQTAL